MLTGDHPQMKSGRRFWAHVPARERCKMCNAPYTGVGGIISQVRGRGPGNWHPRLCHACETFSKGHPGGVELEISMVFVDVRNSTEMSDGLSPSEYARTMNRFYSAATNALTDADAIIDKLVGDEVMALFLPAFAGNDHASKAVEGALAIMERVGYGTSPGPFIAIGAGVNTGTAYVGVVGDEGNYKDFTALGEPINLASRLAQAAGSGEVLVSPMTLSAAHLEPGEIRSIQAKGYPEPVPVTVLTRN
jgi:adenylate cyclase